MIFDFFLDNNHRWLLGTVKVGTVGMLLAVLPGLGGCQVLDARKGGGGRTDH